MRVPTGKAAHRPARQHVGLPVRLILNASRANVERQQKQRVGSRALAAVFEYVRRDQRRLNIWIPDAGSVIADAVVHALPAAILGLARG